MSDKNAFVDKLKAKLESWSAEVDQLEAKAREAKADARLEYQNKLNDLRAKQDRARYELEKINDAGADAWEELKAGARSAWAEFENALDDARSKLSQ